jgi:hypothetical protein
MIDLIIDIKLNNVEITIIAGAICPSISHGLLFRMNCLFLLSWFFPKEDIGALIISDIYCLFGTIYCPIVQIISYKILPLHTNKTFLFSVWISLRKNYATIDVT